jgi:hypothetical protein
MLLPEYTTFLGNFVSETLAMPFSLFHISLELILLGLAFKMATVFSMVTVSCAEKSGDIRAKFDFPVDVVVEYDPQGISVKLKRGKYLMLT